MMDANILNVLNEYDDVLVPADVQKILHIGRNTVYKLLTEGTIQSIRIAGKYRIPKKYLADFMYPDSKLSENNGK